MSFAAAVSALAGATVHPHEAGLIDLLRGRDGTVLDFVRGHALQRSEGGGWLRTIGEATDFARASAATYLDAAGKIQTAASGQQRLTHDGATLSPLGVVVEGARTNLFGNPLWGGPATPTSWSTFSSEGVSEIGSKFGPNVGARRFAANGNRPRAYQGVTLTAGFTYAFSVEVESVTGTFPVAHAVNTLTAGTTVTFPPCPANPAGGAGNAVGVGKLVFTVVSATTQPVIVQVGAGVMHNLTGVAIDLSMPQIEAGAYPTSFIPGGARAAESLYTTLPFDPQGGITVAIRFRGPLMSVPGAAILVALYNGLSTANLLNIYANSGAAILAGAGSLTLTGTSLALGAIAPSSEQRLALSVSATGECRVSRNGEATLSRGLASGVMPTEMTRLDLMSLGGSLQAQTSLARVAVWKGVPFADAEFRGLLS